MEQKAKVKGGGNVEPPEGVKKPASFSPFEVDQIRRRDFANYCSASCEWCSKGVDSLVDCSGFYHMVPMKNGYHERKSCDASKLHYAWVCTGDLDDI